MTRFLLETNTVRFSYCTRCTEHLLPQVKSLAASAAYLLIHQRNIVLTALRLKSRTKSSVEQLLESKATFKNSIYRIAVLLQLPPYCSKLIYNSKTPTKVQLGRKLFFRFLLFESEMSFPRF